MSCAFASVACDDIILTVYFTHCIVANIFCTIISGAVKERSQLESYRVERGPPFPSCTPHQHKIMVVIRGYDYVTPQKGKKKVHRSRTFSQNKSYFTPPHNRINSLPKTTTTLSFSFRSPIPCASPGAKSVHKAKRPLLSTSKKSVKRKSGSHTQTSRGNKLWSFKSQFEVINSSKSRAARALKTLFRFKTKSNNSKILTGTPCKPCTPAYKKRGVEFQYEEISEELSDASALERKLHDGLRVQMTTVPRDVTIQKRTVVYDNWIMKLYTRELVYVLEMWKPTTGEVILNFFDTVNEIYLDEKVGLIYVSRVGGEDDIAIRFGDDTSTRQLCMYLSLCHLNNIGVASVGGGYLDSIVKDGVQGGCVVKSARDEVGLCMRVVSPTKPAQTSQSCSANKLLQVQQHKASNNVAGVLAAYSFYAVIFVLFVYSFLRCIHMEGIVTSSPLVPNRG